MHKLLPARAAHNGINTSSIYNFTCEDLTKNLFRERVSPMPSFPFFLPFPLFLPTVKWPLNSSYKTLGNTDRARTQMHVFSPSCDCEWQIVSDKWNLKNWSKYGCFWMYCMLLCSHLLNIMWLNSMLFFYIFWGCFNTQNTTIVTAPYTRYLLLCFIFTIKACIGFSITDNFQADT